jgi:cytochrome oxidase Cu insertion factor (SCO1/SenC/PrrC family)
MSPRLKLVLIMALFALPIAASLVAYHFFPPSGTTNYGELIAPVEVTSQSLRSGTGGAFRFSQLRGKWLLVASDSGECPAACLEKLATMRQVRLALGRNAERVERIFVVDDLKAPERAALEPFAGTVVALTPTGMLLPPGAANDRAHIYLVDPRGLVMMRWPAAAERARMLKDLNRLLKASQIG